MTDFGYFAEVHEIRKMRRVKIIGDVDSRSERIIKIILDGNKEKENILKPFMEIARLIPHGSAVVLAPWSFRAC